MRVELIFDPTFSYFFWAWPTEQIPDLHRRYNGSPPNAVWRWYKFKLTIWKSPKHQEMRYA